MVCLKSFQFIGIGCNSGRHNLKYIFHQDLFRASDETLCFRGEIILVCLINGRLGESEDYNRAFAPYL